ncbi:SCO2322 family protein [Streptomyces oceani]|uniref:SCO2322 family protein n=1 Tax=Streptomyces oceani TaxID=1075402 RepID=UPI00147B5BEC|nr:SCO2322 family protein [Streptomyces oceani]
MALVGALLGGLLTLGAAPAQAGEYRYWAFWERDGDSWSYARQGPAMVQPEDGSVLGFRFTVGADAGEAGKPRGDADFAEICADEPEESGSARVALVIDFGTAKDAASDGKPPEPRRVCARVDDGGTASDALAASTDSLRYSSAGLLCSIERYPRSGCGEQVSGEGTDGATGDGDSETAGSAEGFGSADGDRGGSDTASSEQDDGLPAGVGLGLGVGAVLVLGAAAYWQARRRRA